MLTRLHPWEIVFQKYFSRIIPIIMFIFLSLPLMAVAYALGGFEVEALGYLFAELIILIFFVGAIGIICSTYFRSSVTAIIFTYINVGAFIGVFFIIPNLSYQYRGSMNGYLTFWMVVQGIFVLIALPLSVHFLKTRRHHRKGNPMLRLFNNLDKFWKDLNSVTGGVEIIKSDNYQLPWINPIRWYEKYKRPSRQITLPRPYYRISFFSDRLPISIKCLRLHGCRVRGAGYHVYPVRYHNYMPYE